jgi:predicted nucleic acid-binding protein
VILVDSSVWIHYLRGGDTPQVRKLDTLLGTVPLAVGDMIVVEVLQGCPSDREFDEVAGLLQTFQQVELCGNDVKVEAARNFRRLRALGITPRKTIDTVIATRCLVSDYELLHDDRDFEPFERHLGLRCVDCRA